MNTILLAEDDPNDSVLLERTFRRLNFRYRLKTIANGQDVIHYLAGGGIFSDRSQHPYPKMLILDWKLPGKGGAEILQWIKGTKDLPPLFVMILASVVPTDAPEETFQQFGKVQVFNCHFLKPITDANLQIVMKLFDAWQKMDG